MNKGFFYGYQNFSYLNNVNSSYLNNLCKSNHPHYDRYLYDTKYSWNKHINSFTLFPYKKSNNDIIRKKKKNIKEVVLHLTK